MVNPTVPSVTLANAVGKASDVLVVGLAGPADSPRVVGLAPDAAKAYAKRFGSSPADLAGRLGGGPKVAQTVLLPSEAGRLLAVGLGEDAPTPETLRRAAAAAARSAAGLDRKVTVTYALPAEEPELLRAVIEGALLGQYAYAPITAKPAPDKGVTAVTVVTALKGKPADQVRDEAVAVATAQLVARDWVNLPANVLFPQSFADQARELVKGSKVDIEVLDEKQLAAGGYGGLTAVGGGSAHTPRLVRLSYAPRGATAHLVLVGKGITFDSGGLNLKPGDSMSTMRCDMGGAAAVLAATRAIADLGLRVRVTSYGCLAENLPSDTAFRPSDVLTMYGGTTVENYNTDAEGRLVMADGLARANEDGADLVVDVATLTGACQVALGTGYYGVFSDSDEVADRLLGAAEAAGERAWRLPMGEWSDKELESKVADLRSGGGRWGGASIAASFLRRFVDEGTDWGHLDIAGPGFNEGGADGETPAGGTGVGVRSLVELARSLAS